MYIVQMEFLLCGQSDIGYHFTMTPFQMKEHTKCGAAIELVMLQQYVSADTVSKTCF